MPRDEEASLWPTNNLLLQEGRKHYRSSVSPIHWQLRSLLSAEGQHILYFPAGVHNTHIQRLDTSTRECETIKVISFHPRCLIASKGWICCGGENGEVVVIRESGSNDAQADTLSRDFRSRLNSMEASNMAEAPMYQLQRDMLTVVERINGSNKTWSASSYKVGTERVNCITIWHPPEDTTAPSRGCYDSPVAIVANNDKTITVIGLYEPDIQKDVLEYPDCVNRGVISPDGSLLVAICDDPYLYIHVRRPYTQHYSGVFCESSKWVSLPRIRLKGPWNKDTGDCRGSFAACFSPSGKYLAVGTQYGTISIFDAVALKDPDSDPLITYFDSDRAPGECGAVRDMAFSPGPYDLLAWSEHRGRIGVADARTNFKRRQIISLGSQDGFQHYSLNDSSTIDPRLLDPRSEENERNTDSDRHGEISLSLLERWGRAMSDRPLPNPESSSAARINQPFSADEVAVLEAFQSDRRRRETRDRGEQLDQRLAEHRSQRAAERSAAWRSPGWAERNATMTRIIERERLRDQHRSGTSLAPPERDRERSGITGRERRGSASIMHTLAQNVDISQLMANRSQGQDNETSNDSSATSRERAASPWFAGRFSSGWNDVENLAMLYGSDRTGLDSSRTESIRPRRGIPVIADVWANDSLFTRIRTGTREHQQNPDDTAGLTWSEDGRTLYAAAEDGIYEVHVNIQGRKVFPDIELR
ncbi:WD40-repeat-containing domain protein [Hypoxylon sp. FL0890]|nr:WD40-repeat-containing domain protein [Hypoxylon sp. FL0890]